MNLILIQGLNLCNIEHGIIAKVQLLSMAEITDFALFSMSLSTRRHVKTNITRVVITSYASRDLVSELNCDGDSWIFRQMSLTSFHCFNPQHFLSSKSFGSEPS